MTNNSLPALPLEEWESTKDTLHLYLQIVGKIRLALAPRKNHWWFITFYVTSRGLETSPIPYKDFTFNIHFNFIEHKLIVTTSRGEKSEFPLEDGLTVAKFYKNLFDILNEYGIDVSILAKPYDNKSTEPFATDTAHSSYDKDYVNRFWHILVFVDEVFKEFSGRFNGKVSPVQLFWHSFDLAVTRFSGREAQMEGGRISDREAYSHEVISAGFWAGDANMREAAFYSYTYPSPEGLDKEPISPKEAFWMDANGSPMAIYKYGDLLQESDPRRSLLSFLESTYDAGAKLADWDVEKFKVRPLV
ncbi:MAG: hypothetical protein KDC73_03305 [Ignavibacteriae bacterium]|nr:hypothetical protein [Ignavibacteriota bacterium]MCB9244252.1 hypothetical protein [Ignavibacteriales bacterium]